VFDTSFLFFYSQMKVWMSSTCFKVFGIPDFDAVKEAECVHSFGKSHLDILLMDSLIDAVVF